MANVIAAGAGGNVPGSVTQSEGNDFSEILHSASRKDKKKRGGEDGVMPGGAMYPVPFMAYPAMRPGGGFRLAVHGHPSGSQEGSRRISLPAFRGASLSGTVTTGLTDSAVDRTRGRELHRQVGIMPSGQRPGGDRAPDGADSPATVAGANVHAAGQAPEPEKGTDSRVTRMAGVMAVRPEAKAREQEKGTDGKGSGLVNAAPPRPVADRQPETRSGGDRQVHKGAIPGGHKEVAPGGRHERQFTLSYPFRSWEGRHGVLVALHKEPVAGDRVILAPSGPLPAEALAQQLNLFPLADPHIVDPDAGKEERERRQQHQVQDEDTP